MFESADGGARVFGLPPGVDFPAELIAGVLARLEGQPPEALGRVHLIVNTRRMARRIQTLLAQGPARLMPRVSLLTELGRDWTMADIAPPAPPLRRRLELIQLIASLLDAQPDLAPRTALYDLASSLATLMDEMEGEGVSPDVIDALDISDQSGHWERIRAFLNIVRHFTQGRGAPGSEARQRRVVQRKIDTWTLCPPDYPIILAGSTGSRGTTQMLMQAVAALPQGAVVLPGYDFDTPDAVWSAMGDAMLSEDHPQYRFRALRSVLGLGDVPRWTSAEPASPERARLVSLALRPAPITDQWLDEGPSLTGIGRAMEDVTLIEAPSHRIEALSIAMRLREAAETGQTAALITPDRGLTRRVAAALDRWGIIPDDSAGMPLHLSPPGRFLRHVAELSLRPLTAEALLTLLKHPLTHSGGRRGDHLRLTRELELHLRRNGPPFPTAATIVAWAAERSEPMAADWAAWVGNCMTGQEAPEAMPLTARVATHLKTAEAIADGAAPEAPSELWQKDAGMKARAVCDLLTAEAPHGGEITATDYAALFAALMQGEQVRNAEAPHSGILIWGTLEARVQGADMLILAGLNEGSWPEAQTPDPWLNRALRHRAGLLLPERRIGLAAHDFQQAVLAKEVWLTRSIRSDESETVVSRWLNRIQNLMMGLPDQGGADALKAMRDRGQIWLDRAAQLEATERVPAAPRPAPCPPVEARPNRLSVTEIKRLIRDPYAIYAKHVLRLRPLDPLMKAPDALLRGIVLHEVLERFVQASVDAPEKLTREALMDLAQEVLSVEVPWAEARALWLARLERVADWFIETEEARRALATPTAYEARGQAQMVDLGFTLVANADRIDIDARGCLHIYDYKTGKPPGPTEQAHFDKQLLLEAAIAERSGFEGLRPAKVARALYIGLGSDPKEEAAPLEDEPADEVWQGLRDLITAYRTLRKGYVSRRAMQKTTDTGDYDQLARYGEWDITDDPTRQEVS
ncbi:double-strand break repair protein AddB [Roseovarius nanhaiticus]|uniref:double-strand break repair protein AddB n=1 Tax=Roseovarius nanhaiticus TaxID=573024 RepID=UPI002492BE20|nr:double-strand break repair protein AddB [Roseovarius nanhaiticus]